MKKKHLFIIILIALFSHFNAVFAQDCNILVQSAKELINDAENALIRNDITEAKLYLSSISVLISPCSTSRSCSLTAVLDIIAESQNIETISDLNQNIMRISEILDGCLATSTPIPLPTFENQRLTPIVEGQRMAFVGHDTFVNGVAINSSGTQIATTASDQTVRLWDINTGAELQQLGAPEYAHSDLGMGVAFSSDGRYLVSSDFAGEVKLWDLSTGEVRYTWNHDGYVWRVAFNPSNSIVASVGSDNFLRLWNVRTGNAIRALRQGSSSIRGLAFSPSGRQILTGAEDGEVVLWDTNSGDKLASFIQHDASVNAVSFSPDGNRIATVDSDGLLIIWDLAVNANLMTTQAHIGQVFSLLWLQNANIIITGGDDGYVRLWDGTTGDLITEQIIPDRFIRAIASTPDESAVLLGMDNGTVILWNLP